MAFHVLHVEDDPADVLLFQRALHDVASRENIPRITSLDNGEDAIAYLAGTGAFADRERYPMPALIVVDLKLPRVSGFEVIEWVRRELPEFRLPMVVLTSSGQQVDIDRAYQLGANSYLVKPIAFEQFREKVESLYAYWQRFNEPPRGEDQG